MLTLGQLGFIVLACWLFIGSLALACVIIGAIGNRIAHRNGRKCPACDYRGEPVDVTIHRIQEHEREH